MCDVSSTTGQYRMDWKVVSVNQWQPLWRLPYRLQRNLPSTLASVKCSHVHVYPALCQSFTNDISKMIFCRWTVDYETLKIKSLESLYLCNLIIPYVIGSYFSRFIMLIFLSTYLAATWYHFVLFSYLNASTLLGNIAPSRFCLVVNIIYWYIPVCYW